MTGARLIEKVTRTKEGEMDEFVGGARLGGTTETGSQERRVSRPWQDSECIPNGANDGANAAHIDRRAKVRAKLF